MGEPSDEPEPGTRSEGKAGRIESTASGAVTALELQTVERSHYAVADEHARGGMGRILAARDLRLDRSVAIKELIEPGPVQEARFVREALVTARLQHPAIVPVYEAGRWPSGEPFYAMKMVSGRSLKELIREAVGLEQRLALLPNVIAVADAIAYAHHQGILHRDLKPANILVGDFGETLVIDWGLAKDVSAKDEQADLGPYGIAASDLTVIGAVMGTPEYMAPEQAGGEALDARADVYALGAMLYHVLAGQAPFAGESSAEVLRQVRGGPPPAIEAREPRVPTDLAAIVGKAMARRPEERYPSAQELAADLRRFQAGQLVAAYRYSARERARRWIQRRRALLAVTLGGLLLAAVLLGLWLRSRFSASEQALAAQRFGQEVERIDRTLREAYLLPLHDIRAEKTLVRQRMQTIESEMRRLGSAAWGPGHYALGRAHLALGEYEAARGKLEIAWNSGSRTSDTAQALGLALGALYERALAQQRSGDAQTRAALQREIEKSYRDPALRYLRESGAATREAAGYLQALMAYYEKRYDAALAQAEVVAAASPGLYEASRLAGDVSVAMAASAHRRGDYDAAATQLLRAGEAYARALSVARSDPSLFTGDCSRAIAVATLSWDRGRSPEAALGSALAPCQRALQADPESAESHATLSHYYAELATRATARGQDPREAVSKSVAAASAALRYEPRHFEAHMNIGLASASLADYRFWHGQDARGAIEEALSGLEAAVRIDPRPNAVSTLGSCYRLRALDEEKRGLDPRPSLQRAIERYEQAIGRDPELVNAHNNAGNAWSAIAVYELAHGADPRLPVEKAVAAYRNALRLAPQMAVLYNNIGTAYWCTGAYELARGADPREALSKAVESYSTTMRLNPEYFGAFLNVAEAEAMLGAYAVESGRDPGLALAEARRALAAADRLQPALAETSVQAAKVELVAARWAVRIAGQPEALFATALRAAQRAGQLDRTRADVPRIEADIHRWRAEWRLARGGAWLEDVRQGQEAARRALAMNPREAEALCLQAAFQLLAGRGRRPAAGPAALAAAALLEQAFELNPLLKHGYQSLLDEARRASAS